MLFDSKSGEANDKGSLELHGDNMLGEMSRKSDVRSISTDRPLIQSMDSFKFKN